MPTDAKTLFRPDAIRPKLAKFTFLPAAVTACSTLARWAKLHKSKKTDGG